MHTCILYILHRFVDGAELEGDLNDCYIDNPMAMAAPCCLFAIAYTVILILPHLAVLRHDADKENKL